MYKVTALKSLQLRERQACRQQGFDHSSIKHGLIGKAEQTEKPPSATTGVPPGDCESQPKYLFWKSSQALV